MLSMESGVLLLREGPVVKYPIDYVYELERYIYVKEGKTRFYPTHKKVNHDPRRRPAREVTGYLTPVFIYDGNCKVNGVPTGDCPQGTLTIS
jgi:hypothetical protein